MIHSACPDPAAPPMNVQSSDIRERQATISWLPPPFEDQNGIILYYQLVLTQNQFDIPDVIINTTTLTDTVTVLEEYTEYKFMIAAATSIGLGSFSSPMMFMTLPTGTGRIAS